MKITIEWNEQKKNEVCEKIDRWIKEYDAHSGEGIMQDDDCQIYAPVLLSELVDEVIKPMVDTSDED